MAVFLGEYEHSIDQKGRVAIPARFRDEFRGGLVLSRGFDKCLIAYPLAEWQKMAERLASLPTTRSSTRRLNRTTFSAAFNLGLDRQGRITLPTPLKEYAEIKDGVIIAGLNNYLEIWSKELWASEKDLMNEQAWQIAESVEVRS